MRRFVCALALLFLAVPSRADVLDELGGLWKASRWFGPRARGTLVIQRSGDAYTADVAGRVVAVKVANGEMSFSLPNGEGTFRGKLQANGIAGTWIPPKALGMADLYVSPVRLERAGPDRWIGQVMPFEDTFTFYTAATSAAGGGGSAPRRSRSSACRRSSDRRDRLKPVLQWAVATCPL